MAAPDEKPLIRAAGGLLWRQCATGREVAVVHRRRYDDWTLPKGKLNEGESWQDAALREVREETGYGASIVACAGATSYQVDGSVKVVRFWHMMANGNVRGKIDETEVVEVHWFAAEAALKRLDYPLERALLEASLDEPALVVRRGSSDRKGWRWPTRSASRLGNTIGIVESELDALVDQAREAGGKQVGTWNNRSRQLLDAAKKAVEDGDAERGWRFVKAADRFMLYGLTAEQLVTEAKPLLAEANDESKDLSAWRKASVRDLLCDDDGKLKSPLVAYNVVRARRIIDEHHDNTYYKIEILRSRLRLLAVGGLLVLTIWLISPPISPAARALPAATAGVGAEGWLSTRLAWLGIIVAGVLGALFSGFSTSIASDRKNTRIPSELSSSTVTFARLSMAAVASLAASIFVASDILKIATPTYELMLAVAFAAGFSDRLLLRGLESISK